MSDVQRHTIILLHGGPSFYGYMNSLRDLIDPQKYHVIDYAQRGTHEYPSHDPVTLSDHLQDLRDQVNTHTQGHYSIIGHSWGANLALLFAAQNPPNLCRIILLGTAPLSFEIEDLFTQQLDDRMDPQIQQQLEELDISLRRELERAESPIIDELFAQRIKLIEPLYHHNPITSTLMPPCSFKFSSFLETKGELWRLITAGEVPQILARIKVQVSLIHGELDIIPVDETFAFLKACIPQVTSTMLAQTGHFPWLEPQSAHACLEAIYRELSTSCDQSK